MTAGAMPGLQVEKVLEDLIHKLTNTEPTAEVRAVLIEARRLRNVTMRWSAIPPPPDARREMLTRVMDLIATLNRGEGTAGTSTYLSTPPARSARVPKNADTAPPGPIEAGLEFELDVEDAAPPLPAALPRATPPRATPPPAASTRPPPADHAARPPSQRSTMRAPDSVADTEARRNVEASLPPPNSLRPPPPPRFAAVAPSSSQPPLLRQRVVKGLRVDVAPGINVVRPGLSEWMAHPGVHGARVKLLYRDAMSGLYTALVHLPQGVVLPAREHAAPEEVLVIEGSVTVGDVTMHEGDFCRAEEGSRHPSMSTDTGCTLYLSGSEFDAFVEG